MSLVWLCHAATLKLGSRRAVRQHRGRDERYDFRHNEAPQIELREAVRHVRGGVRGGGAERQKLCRKQTFDTTKPRSLCCVKQCAMYMGNVCGGMDRNSGQKTVNRNSVGNNWGDGTSEGEGAPWVKGAGVRGGQE